MRSLIRPLCLALIAICVAVPATASAAVTIGSTLPPVPGVNASNNVADPTETVFNEALAPASTAPGGLTAPSYGVIVRFRIETRVSDGIAFLSPVPVQLRTIHDQGATHFKMVSTEASTHPVADANAIQQFDTRLPIQAGHQLGLDVVASMGSAHLSAGATDAAASKVRFISPRVSDGTTTSGTQQTSKRLLLQADVEADADFDGYGDETQDLCPTDASRQTACPVIPLAATAKPRKKCKKARHKSAAAAKKCKKKRRRR